jgi:SAM-dependent methyltransferase
MSYTNFAAFYDRLQEADYDEIGAYYHKRLSESGAAGKGKILLDLACGTGVLSRYFAELNYDVLGVDISPEMLSIAMEKPHENIQYLRQDMTRLDLFGTIDCCICALDSLNHLPDYTALRKAFKSIALFMNKGGVFAFDMNTLYKHNEILSGNDFVIEKKELFCTWQNSFCEDGRVDITLDVFCRGDYKSPDWQRHTQNLTETAYELTEITELLEEAGFGGIKIYDWLSDEAANELSEKAVFVAVKL